MMIRRILIIGAAVAEIIMLPLLVFAAVVSRFVGREIDVGLGPQPLLNNVYHKKALEKYGYSSETFVDHVYYITSKFDKVIGISHLCNERISKIVIRGLQVTYFYAIFRYKCLYFYFNGGPLFACRLIWRLEPYLYKLAGIKTVLMPYGGDVDEMTRCPNLMFKHGIAIVYPSMRFSRGVIQKKIDLWTVNADHIIAGCDWVYFLYYWDTLMISHFSFDTEKWTLPDADDDLRDTDTIRILHATNHRELKGTRYFIEAIDELKNEGYNIDFMLMENVSNDQVMDEIKKADIVADQLIIGWYALFAIEAMNMGKPVLCSLSDDLYSLYRHAGLVEKDEIPIVNCNCDNVKETIKELIDNRKLMRSHGKRGPEYVRKHHSLESVGMVFDKINKELGLSSQTEIKR